MEAEGNDGQVINGGVDKITENVKKQSLDDGKSRVRFRHQPGVRNNNKIIIIVASYRVHMSVTQ